MDRIRKKRKFIIVMAVLAAALVAETCIFAAIRIRDGSGRKDNENRAAETAEEQAAETSEAPPAESDAPVCTLVLASDYQAEEGFPDPAETFAGLLRSVKTDGRTADNVIICGDYTNDDDLYNYELSPDASMEEIREIIGKELPGVPQEDIIFVQGNHDALTDAVSESGLHEYDDYLVYVLNTQYDFPWMQGRDAAFRDRVIAASETMKECFDGLIAKGETRPVFIAGHVPLHFTARTSSRHTTGDNMYSAYIFDVVNEAAKDLDIIYLFGHDHSKGWDCYLGGASIYRAPGDSILIPDAEGRTGSTDEYTEETLDFTYMNAGYTGYYMNCAPEEYSSDEDSPYHAADETLTCTTAEIYPDRIVITRFDQRGVHVLGAAGEADPYRGGIDEGLIGPEHHSKETAGPAVIKRKSAFKSGTIRTDGKNGDEEDEEKDKDKDKDEEKDAA